MVETNLKAVKEKIYTDYDNWFEEYPHANGKKCYIFFSSNGLYPDSTAEELRQTLVDNGRYEWKSMANAFKYHKNLGKIIYVRDIYKAFYIYGINKQLNSIDKVVEKLRKLTEGYQVTTVGISSGGYMAVVCASALKAERAFCFSGQFNLKNHLKELELEYCNASEERRKYINVLNFIKQNHEIPTYYFCPVGCEHDYRNYLIVKDEENFKCFLFPDKVHAATVYPFNFPDLLFLPNVRLDRLCGDYLGKEINKNMFYMKTVTLRGFVTLVSYILRTKFRMDLLKRKWDV